MKNKMQSKSRKSSPKVHFESSSRHLTSQAGMIPVVKFLENMDSYKVISDCINVSQGANAQYSAADLIVLIAVGIVAGGNSLEKVIAVWGDSVLRRLSGWKKIPDSTVISRTLKKFGLADVIGLEMAIHALRKNAWNITGFNPDNIIIDLDSTVKTVYGNQEGAEKGFNIHKKGAKSYHHQLAFCAETKEILQGWFRCGDAYTSNGSVEFMKQLTAGLAEGQKYLLRADSGYFNGELLDWLEDNGKDYLIKVKMKNLNRLLIKQDWKEIKEQPGWEQASFKYNCQNWSKERSFVAVRKKIEEKEDSQRILDVERYDYFCYVTSEELSPWETHKKYGQRATCETWIEEAKNQMGLGHIKTNSFLANSAIFQAAILAYNTLRWMGLKSSQKALRQWEPTTIRTYILRTAANLTTGGRTFTMVTSDKHLYPELWNEWLNIGGIAA